MKSTVSVRRAYFFSFLILVCFTGFTFYLQSQGFTPCALCLLQRSLMIILSIVFFIGMLFHFNKWGTLLFGMSGLIVTFAGMLLAGRQSWLQYMPPQGSGNCGVSLQYLINILPMTEVAKMVWQGGTECSELGWVFMGLSLAEWSLITFGVFFIFILLQLKRSLNA